MPAAEPLFVTPSGVEITGFRSAGDAALRWWEQLRQAYPEGGLWPLVMEADTPDYLAEAYTYATAAESLARAHTLDGAGLLATAWTHSSRVYFARAHFAVPPDSSVHSMS